MGVRQAYARRTPGAKKKIKSLYCVKQMHGGRNEEKEMVGGGAFPSSSIGARLRKKKGYLNFDSYVGSTY